MFKIYDSYYGTTKWFDSWWSLIGYIVIGRYEKAIAHNANDIYVSFCFGYVERETYSRHLFVQDEFDRIINLAEIREGIKIYVDHPRQYKRRNGFFRFRYDPVPGIGKRRHGGWYRTSHSYRKCYLDALSVETDLPEARLQKNLDMGCAWDDEFPRVNQRTWKKQGKMNRQWERTK